MLNRAAIYGDQALWMRKAYKEAFQNNAVTAVIRPGDRSASDHINFIPSGVPMPVRFIDKPGTGGKGTPGNLLPDEGTTIERTEVLVRTLQELTEEDLRGCTPDCVTPELARYHLANIYNSELPGPDFVVTIWRFKYLPVARE